MSQARAACSLATQRCALHLACQDVPENVKDTFVPAHGDGANILSEDILSAKRLLSASSI